MIIKNIFILYLHKIQCIKKKIMKSKEKNIKLTLLIYYYKQLAYLFFYPQLC